MTLVETMMQAFVMGILIVSSITFYQLYNIIESDTLTYNKQGQVERK